MREFSKVSPRIWESSKFEKLSDKDKLLYFYIITNHHNNSCGCYRLPYGYIVDDLGWEKKSVQSGIDTLCDTVLIGYDLSEKLVRIPNHFTFNPPQNPKHAMKVFREIELLPDSELKYLVANDYNVLAEDKEGWKIYPIDTVYYTVSAQDLDKTYTKTDTKTALQRFTESDLSELNEWFSKHAPSVNKLKLKDKLLDWCSAKGKPYKNYFAALKIWAKDEHEKNLVKGWQPSKTPVNRLDPYAHLTGGPNA